MPNPYSCAQDLFNLERDFARPIDLSRGGVHQVAPLQEPAMLELGTELMLIMPERNCPARSQQDYTVVALNAVLGLSHYREMRERQEVIDRLNRIDFAQTQDLVGLLPGILIVRNGEEVEVGRRTTPLLNLGTSVASSHATIEANDAGLKIGDSTMRNRLLLRLANSDAVLPHEVSVPEKIDQRTRDALFDTYAELCDDSRFEIINDDVAINGMLCLEEGSERVDLFIKSATEYPSLNPTSDYRVLKITVDLSKEGVETCSFAKTVGRRPGITRVDVNGQLTRQQANDLMRMGLNLSI